jgi:Kef-type K+ transport system membrane component KefB
MTIHPPEGPAWAFLLLVLVIIVAPWVAERLRLPGIIGLLVGGFLIKGVEVGGGIPEATVVDFLGQIGLLYLMYLAGLELDLNVFARLRNAAITFGLFTFALPFVLGVGGALLLGYEVLAAVLIGSFWSSHTLLTYPVVRRFGLAQDRAVATSVGATIITDTMSLTILAVVAGIQVAGGFEISAVVGVGLGLGLLAAYCFLILPRVVRWSTVVIGQERTLRFLVILAAGLSAAVIADMLGIEGIVGAFFAGLALNRLVPNGGPLMESVEFVGSSIFIPAFLVSVGLLVDLAVMFQPATLALAGVFLVAVLGGKGMAALAAGRRFGFSSAQVGVMFSLTVAQAAATLAAVSVGTEIGLIGPDVLNATIVVVVVSLIAASLTANRFAPRVPAAAEEKVLGAAVVVPVDDAGSAGRVVRLARRIAEPDGGVVLPIHVLVDVRDAETAAAARRNALEIDAAVRQIGIEAEPSLHVARSLVQGVRNVLLEHGGTLVVLERAPDLGPADYILGGHVDAFVAASTAPVVVAMLRDVPLERVVVALSAGDFGIDQRINLRLTLETARRLHRSGLDLVVGIPDGATLPPDAQPAADATSVADAKSVAYPGGRRSWVKSAARAGDLVVLPAASGPWVIGIDAASSTRLPDVSVAVVVGAFGAATFGRATSTGTAGLATAAETG